jgi:hypothetical protein
VGDASIRRDEGLSVRPLLIDEWNLHTIDALDVHVTSVR